MGRHRDEQAAAASGAAGSGLVVLGVVAVLALVLVGFGVRSLFFSGDAVADDSSSNTSPETEAATGQPDDAEESVVPDMGEGEGGTEDTQVADESDTAQQAKPEEEESAEPTSDEPEALQSCRAEVAAGDAYAAATATAAANWKEHYSASVQYNAGEISLATAERQFAESKARGPADLEAISSTSQAYEEARGACEGIEAAEFSDAWAQEAQTCSERSVVLADVAETGSDVNSDWAEHIEMMGNKDQVDPGAYYDRWRSMVKAAPDAMEPYEKAAEALQQAPVCP
ncbi:MAG: hypothetical protein WBG57_11775 [Ornithinimicrobium sp.]